MVFCEHVVLSISELEKEKWFLSFFFVCVIEFLEFLVLSAGEVGAIVIEWFVSIGDLVQCGYESDDGDRDVHGCCFLVGFPVR